MSPEDVATESARTRTTVTDGLDRLMSVSADRVFAEPVPVRGRVQIPAARVDFSGSFGFGLEHGASEAADGGHRVGRRVAVIEAGPEGVRVKPVVDRARVGLALLAAGVAIWGASRRRSRR